MKITLLELKNIILDEVKKKAEADKDPKDAVQGYVSPEALDFSKPLGDENLYKKQGKSVIGPFTEEKALRIWIGNIIAEAMQNEKHLGFKKLVQKLAHKKGVKNAKGLAAKIGREKYGAAGMAKKAAAGKKK